MPQFRVPGGEKRQGARRPGVRLDGVENEVLIGFLRGDQQLDGESEVTGDRAPNAALGRGVFADAVVVPPASDVRVEQQVARVGHAQFLSAGIRSLWARNVARPAG